MAPPFGAPAEPAPAHRVAARLAVAGAGAAALSALFAVPPLASGGVRRLGSLLVLVGAVGGGAAGLAASVEGVLGGRRRWLRPWAFPLAGLLLVPAAAFATIWSVNLVWGGGPTAAWSEVAEVPAQIARRPRPWVGSFAGLGTGLLLLGLGRHLARGVGGQLSAVLAGGLLSYGLFGVVGDDEALAEATTVLPAWLGVSLAVLLGLWLAGWVESSWDRRRGPRRAVEGEPDP